MIDNKDYFDAKFEGVEKLIRSEKENTLGYIEAVSSNVRDVRKDLQAHKESSDAHGAGLIARGKGEWVSFVALLTAAGTLAVEIFKNH